MRYLLRQQHQFPEQKILGEYLQQIEGEVQEVCRDTDNPYIGIVEYESLRALQMKNRRLSEKPSRLEVAYTASFSGQFTKPLRWCFSVLSGRARR